MKPTQPTKPDVIREYIEKREAVIAQEAIVATQQALQGTIKVADENISSSK